MELKRYFALVRRWLWLGILGAVLGAAGGYYFSSNQTPVYQASTRFMILRSAQTGYYDYYAFLENQQLVQTYVQLLTTEGVLSSVEAELGYPVQGSVSAAQVADTQFVDLVVEDTNPDHAAAIANVLVTILIDKNEELQSVRYITSEQNLQSQIDDVLQQINTLQTQINDISSATVADQLNQVQAQIDVLQAQVSDLKVQISDLEKRKPQTAELKTEIANKQATLDQLEPVLTLYQQVYTNLLVLGQPVEGADNTTTRLDQLQTTLSLYQQIYVNLLNSLEAVRLARVQNTPNVVQIKQAVAPPLSAPIRPKPYSSALQFGGIGLALAAAIAFLVEYLDDTLKTLDDIERVLNLPVIGYIAQIRYDKGSAEQLYVTRQPRSPVSEAFRSLRANLEFAGVDHPLRRILVTSAAPGEGKTTISVNLAAIISQGGRKVLILDGDLRRPKVHRYLNLPNQMGLSDLFRSSFSLHTVVQGYPEQEDLSIVTSGSLPPNPAELLASARMDHIIQEAEREAEIVIIDSPPALVADVQILAAKVDGVLMVVHPGHTHADAALATQEQLTRAGARILGVVLNRIPRHRADYYGGYRHYSPYYSGYQYHYYSGEDGRKSRSVFRRLFQSGPNGHKKSKPIERQDAQVEKQK
ncbi:MAG: polysaccharide biosynthesis tyrosine autokinase [Chloroflexota bacterium]